MKHIITKLLSFLFLGLFLSLISPVDVKAQIVSAPGGGNWNNPATWVGGSIPGAADNVVIASTVSVNVNPQCNNITIESGSVLQNASSYYYTLTVNGNLTNQGTIQNNTSNTLAINVMGNVSNSGVLSNNSLNFTGTTNQQMASTHPMQLGNLVRTSGIGWIKATTNLEFVGTAINLNSDTLEFTSGGSLSLDGGNLFNCIIYKSALPAFHLSTNNGTYCNNFTIDSPQTILNGNLSIFGNNNVFKHDVINNGSLQNRNDYHYTLTIEGNLTNNGVIQNSNSNQLTIYISGNLTNNGTWQNYSTLLNGTGIQQLAMTQPFSGAYFTKNLTAGRAVATTGLSFVGTRVDLKGDTLEFTTGSSISLDGGYLQNGVVFKAALPALQITAGNTTYFSNITLDSPRSILEGLLLVYGSNNVFKQDVINNGTIQNRSDYFYSLTVDGNLTNNGIIQNGTSNNLTIYISGNFSNNGTWQNITTVLNGTEDQELSMTQPFSGTNFQKTASTGLAKAISNLSFNGTKIDFSDGTLEFTSGNSLSMTNGYFYRGNLHRTTSPALVVNSNGNYFEKVTIDSPHIMLNGILLISGNDNVFKHEVINNGTLQNRSNYYHSLAVDGNLTNNGVIQNAVSYNLTILISGDVSNNGLWKNRQTTLTGTNNRTLSFSKRFEGVNFTKSVAEGNLNATTNLEFDGSAVNLKGSLLTLPDDGYISVLNGTSFGDVVIAGNDVHFNTLAASCYNVQFSTNVSLHGVFQGGQGIVFNGNVVNHGTMRNRSDYYREFSVAGDLVNNGSIENNGYRLFLTILGDITNNGTWNNYQTILDGVADQYVYLNNSIDGRLLLDANNTGAGNWFGPSGSLVGNSNFSGATGLVLTFLNAVTSAFEGQYYRTGSGGNSRSIYINTPTNPARLVTMHFLLEGLYLTNGTMRASLDGNANPVFGATIADQVSISLHDNTNFSNILFTREGAQLSTDGNVSFIVPGNFTGNYYLSIRHRSGIVTSSATPVSFNTQNVSYNFDQPSKAYGNNLVQTLDGHYALYGGDVNQDGVVDTSDMTPVDNEAADFAVGYRNPDTNGDGTIDTSDMTIVDNNAQSFVSVILP